jgi:hypothetical protein
MPNNVGPGKLDKVGVTCGIAEHPAVVPELVTSTSKALATFSAALSTIAHSSPARQRTDRSCVPAHPINIVRPSGVVQGDGELCAGPMRRPEIG